MDLSLLLLGQLMQLIFLPDFPWRLVNGADVQAALFDLQTHRNHRLLEIVTLVTRLPRTLNQFIHILQRLVVERTRPIPPVIIVRSRALFITRLRPLHELWPAHETRLLHVTRSTATFARVTD